MAEGFEVEGLWFLVLGLRAWGSGLARDVHAGYWKADGTFYLLITALITLLIIPQLDICRLSQLEVVLSSPFIESYSAKKTQTLRNFGEPLERSRNALFCLPTPGKPARAFSSVLDEDERFSRIAFHARSPSGTHTCIGNSRMSSMNC